MGEEKASSDSESNSAVVEITNNKAENHKPSNSETQDDNEINQENSNSKDANCTDVNCTNSKDSTNESNEPEKEQQFCLAPTNNQFKLRIVPIEKLLEKPLNESAKESNGQNDSRDQRRVRKNVSVIELSDSEEGSGNEDQIQIKPKKPKKDNSEREPARKSSRIITGNDSQVNAKFKRKVCVRLKRINLSSNSEKPLKDKSIPEPPKTNKAMPSSEEKPSSSRRKVPSTDNEDSDFEPSKKSTNSDANVDVGSESATSEHFNNKSSNSKSSSESEIIPVRRKRIFAKKKSESEGNESDVRSGNQTKKRRRVKKTSNSEASDSDSETEQNKNKRKHIRKIIKAKDLDISTKTAAKEEEERRKRIEERQKLYNQIYEKPDSVEVAELVLDFDEESKQPLLEVDKGLLKKLKPHQVSGVKFMWDACFETVSDTQEKPGSGCILAHCMGLGKTLQIVTLSHTLLSNSRKTNVERVLIISPLSTLNNWAREFKHWMSFTRKKSIEIYDMSKYRDKPTRIYKLNEWFDEGGVCIMGYDMYRILANEKAKGLRKPQREILKKALIDPGPDMVVCDEGHLLKNEKTSISQAVTKMRTKRRIVLTGTPLQNNLKEYYCMIQFIKPNLLGTYKEYLNRFVNPITNGQYTDSTERDIRLMKHRSHILHNMLEGCIQRRDYSVLAPYLPPKHEYVVYTTLSELQQQLYEYYMTIQRDLLSSDIGGKGARLFQDFQDLRRIWTHPMSLRFNSDSVIKKRMRANESDSMDDFIADEDDEDEESANSSDSSESSSVSNFSGAGGGKSGSAKKSGRKIRTNSNKKDSDAEEQAAKEDPSEWYKKYVQEKDLNNINHSPKLLILMRLLEQCEAIGDKLLVFSQSLQSLDVIEHFLSLIDSKTKGRHYEGDVGDCKGYWTLGKDYFRLDGSCSVEHRESMCKQFNDRNNLRARLFLISTRAGGLGINLVAANRVVIFDVSWNPSHDTQSIFRVYRFGQDKLCYIYRLIAMGTMEQKVYERQVAKQATAKRVIDEQQISRHYNQSDLQELYTYELKPLAPREIPNLPKDRLFAELLSEQEHLLYKYHEHDSLLENEESENLSEAERKAAWSEYEAEKTRSAQAAQYISYDRNAFGNQFASGSVTSNKIFGFRSDVLLQLLNMKIAQDHPELNQNQVIQLVPGYLQRLYAEMNNGDPTLYKDLLGLHATIAHPSGLYMNPLLYANQNPEAAGYMQTPAPAPFINMAPPPLPPMMTLQRPPPVFNPDEVYEID